MSADEADERAAPPARPQAGPVRGERGAALVGAVRSLQSRASNVLAAALMIALGLAALTWYYAHAFTRQARTRAGAQATASGRAQGEMALPALGPISPPAPREPAERATPGAPAPLPPDLPLTEASAPGAVAGANPAVPAAKTPAQLAFDRRLSGVVFTREAQGIPGACGRGRQRTRSAASPATSPRGWRQCARGPARADTGCGRPGAAPAGRTLPAAEGRLHRLHARDCDRLHAAGHDDLYHRTDTFGADGKVVLLERGTKLVGETRGQVQQGQARVFVLWTEARTPTGVVVPLDSPGTDELGRAGVTGEVNRHFWQRFGAAMLISLIDGAVQAGVQAAASGERRGDLRTLGLPGRPHRGSQRHRPYRARRS